MTAQIQLRSLSASLIFLFILSSLNARAQEQASPPPVVSPEVVERHFITFRLRAPKAEAVRVLGGDIPGLGRGLEMQKSEDGVWTATAVPVGPGAYRYHFEIAGVQLNDPRNQATSESNNASWSVVVVPGSDAQDVKDVPHGTLSRVTYLSKSLKRVRRMTIYTPPGYERGAGTFPVLYLLHGSSDSDDSWSSVGRAGFILDNLIAAGNAKPMIVVMPHGHTNPPQAESGENNRGRQTEEFVADFNSDIRPTIEKGYRVRTDRASRAIAGLSMGGSQSMEISMRNLNDYGFVGVFSSGVTGGDRPRPGPKFDERHLAALDNAEAKLGLQLLWFATGKDDFVLKSTQATVDMLKQHGFQVTYQETSGGHTWLNWRDYLHQFAPLLFNETTTATR